MSQRIEMRILNAADNCILDGEQILSIQHTAQCCGDALSIGTVSAAAVTIRVNGIHALLNETIVVELGKTTENTTVWSKLGTFLVTECKDDEEMTTLTAYDAAYFATSRPYVPTVNSGATAAQIITDIATQCGLMLDDLFPFDGAMVVSGDLNGHSCREMLGYMAMLAGRNAIISREGKLRLVWFQGSGARLTANDYYEGELSLGGEAILSGIVCETGVNNSTENSSDSSDDSAFSDTNEQAYQVGSSTNPLILTNPYMTQVRLESLWCLLGGYRYPIVSCAFFGGEWLEPGMLVPVESRGGRTVIVPVMKAELSLDGGCRANLSSSGDEQLIPPLGPASQRIEDLKDSIRTERTAREAAVARLATQMTQSGGLYSTIDPSESGSVYYLHNKPALNESALVVKLNAAGIAISQDGGESYPYGFNFVTGESIAETIHAGAAWVKQLFANDIEASGSIKYVFKKGTEEEAVTSIGKGGFTISVPGAKDSYFSINNIIRLGQVTSCLNSQTDMMFVKTPHLEINETDNDIYGDIMGHLTVKSMSIGNYYDENSGYNEIQMSGRTVSAGEFVENGTALSEKYLRRGGGTATGNLTLGSHWLYFDTDYGVRGSNHNMLRETTLTNSDKKFVGVGNSSQPLRLYGTNVYLSGTSTAVTSDQRMKKDFKSFDERYEAFFSSLQPKCFRYVVNGSERYHTGFVAQEVEAALAAAGIDSAEFAGFVADDVDSEALKEQGFDLSAPEWADARQLYLRYEEFIALNTHMIQQLSKRVAELEGQISTLRQQLERA